MANKEVVLERLETKKETCKGCIFDAGSECLDANHKFNCEVYDRISDSSKSYIWRIRTKKRGKK
jgi:hypothetical protein